MSLQQKTGFRKFTLLATGFFALLGTTVFANEFRWIEDGKIVYSDQPPDFDKETVLLSQEENNAYQQIRLWKTGEREISKSAMEIVDTCLSGKIGARAETRFQDAIECVEPGLKLEVMQEQGGLTKSIAQKCMASMKEELRKPRFLIYDADLCVSSERDTQDIKLTQAQKVLKKMSGGVFNGSVWKTLSDSLRVSWVTLALDGGNCDLKFHPMAYVRAIDEYYLDDAKETTPVATTLAGIMFYSGENCSGTNSS